MTVPTAPIEPSARAEILRRVRVASAEMPAVVVPRDYRRVGGPPGSPELVTRFAERVTDYRARVHRCTGADVTETISRIVAEQGRRRLVTPPGLPPECTAAAIDAVDGGTATISDLDASEGTISTCAVAIAETGTVVLDGGPGQGRRALSLVPDYLLVVVRADQIVDLVGEALARLDPTRPLTWISGPSATSDIELNRVEGVHGPRTLDVLIRSDS